MVLVGTSKLIFLLESGLTKVTWAEQQSRWGCWLFHLRAGSKLVTRKKSRCSGIWRMGQKESAEQWPNTTTPLSVFSFVEGWGTCMGIHKLLLWQQVRKGHLMSSRPPEIRWFFDLPAHLNPGILTAAYPEVWKSCIPSGCPGQSCSQCVGMDSRDQSNDTHKGNFLFSMKQLDEYTAWVSGFETDILCLGPYSLKISLV